MGDDQAQALEQAFGKPAGWFDRDPYIDQIEARFREVTDKQSTYNIWPFRRIDASRVTRLDDQTRARLEDALLGVLAVFELEKRAEPEGGIAA